MVKACGCAGWVSRLLRLHVEMLVVFLIFFYINIKYFSVDLLPCPTISCNIVDKTSLNYKPHL